MTATALDEAARRKSRRASFPLLPALSTRQAWGLLFVAPYIAIFLGFVAVLPFLATRLTDVQALQISAAGLLIVVGVVIDTMRQIEAQMMMRNYEGFIS